jgi:hypothetical protein
VVAGILVCSAHTIVGTGKARTEAQALCLHITLPSPDGSQRPALIQNFRLDSCNAQEPRYSGLPLPTHLGCFSALRLHFVTRTLYLAPCTSHLAPRTKPKQPHLFRRPTSRSCTILWDPMLDSAFFPTSNLGQPIGCFRTAGFSPCISATIYHSNHDSLALEQACKNMTKIGGTRACSGTSSIY